METSEFEFRTWAALKLAQKYRIIQDKDVEIERLKLEYKAERKEWQFLFLAHRRLLTSAADALEAAGWMKGLPWSEWKKLIEELREAAK